jgi:glutamate racemase
MSAPAVKPTAQNIIGVFDSGLGGLTVLKYLLQELPNYNYIYLGDNARVPYGEKSPEIIYQYTREAVDWLFTSGCNLIIIACNTATGQALRRLQQEYLPVAYPQRRLLGVIRPLVENIAQNKNLTTVGVIGTKATISTQAYQTELHKLRPDLTVISKSTPLLVPLIEEGWANKPETKMILKKYLRPLKIKNIQALLLGCTHYPYLYPAITRIMGRRISVPQPGPIISASLKDYLVRHPELGLQPVAAPMNKYYTTDSPQLFRALGKKLLGQPLPDLAQISLTELSL